MKMFEQIPGEFSVCKLAADARVELARPFHFFACTDRERSLVCPTRDVPASALAREDGWRAVRVAGTLDFSLVGILARISGALAAEGIPLFAVSTYDTDYVLVKSESFDRALRALERCDFGAALPPQT